jgi:hypothetical protein
MYTKKFIGIGNLLLDLSNYRHGKLTSQKGARDAIILGQGKKLAKLAEDIVENGLNPFDMLMVVDAQDGNDNFVVVEGNRRLTCLNLLIDPELAKETSIHRAFVRLNKTHAKSIPKVLECVLAPDKLTARIWINRKHANGLEGAGTEHWTAMAKARADVDAGEKRPELDVVNFLLTKSNLDSKLRHHLEGGNFNLSTLQRLVTTKELQEAAGFQLKNGELIAECEKEWLHGVLTNLVTTIFEGRHHGVSFTERDIDTSDKRQSFVGSLISDHSKRKKAKQCWAIMGKPMPASMSSKPVKPSNVKGTVSTEEQVNLIPKKFKLELPPGKINDVFIELKKLDVSTYRHSVSVLFRVFIEFSLEDYIKKHAVQLPKKKGADFVDDRLITKLKTVVHHVKENRLMDDKQLKSLNVAVSDRNSFLSPETLNAYVHSAWMNPDPLRLKLAWADIQPFLETLWVSKT